MRGRYTTIVSMVGARVVSALALLAAVGGIFAVSRALECGKAIDYAPIVVAPTHYPSAAVVFDPLIVGHEAAGHPSHGSPARSGSARPVDRVRPAASPQLPVVVRPNDGSRRRLQPPPQPAPPPTATPAPSAPVAPLEPVGSGVTSAHPPGHAGGPTSAAPRPTRPGWGHGDPNHSHAGPHGSRTASPPIAPATQNPDANSHGSGGPTVPQSAGEPSHGAAWAQAPDHRDPATPCAAAGNAPADGGGGRSDSNPPGASHGGG